MDKRSSERINDESPPEHRIPWRRLRPRVWLSPTILLATLGIVVLSSCERTPSKSDYVSARVSELCQGQKGDELRACRIAVIKQFQNTSLEEMQRRYPRPEPRPRPSCSV
jgi:hypothetical protein